jgi:hypothetical protein
MQQEFLKKHRSVGKKEDYWWPQLSKSYLLPVLEEPRISACREEAQRNECCQPLVRNLSAVIQTASYPLKALMLLLTSTLPSYTA